MANPNLHERGELEMQSLQYFSDGDNKSTHHYHLDRADTA